MRGALQKAFPIIVGAIITLGLAGLLIVERFDLQLQRDRLTTQDNLQVLAGELSAALNRGAAGGQKGWHSWSFQHDAYVSSEAVAPLVAEATLGRTLAQLPPSATARLIGPFATETGSNALAIVSRRSGDVAAPWTGASALLDDILPTALTTALLKNHRLQLLGGDGSTALYQSDEGTFDQPVVAAFRFGTSALQLRAVPRSGWHMPVRWWSASLLILMAVVLWLTYEHRRGSLLFDAAEDLALAEDRRKQANRLYGQAIENVAALESRLQIVSMYDNVTGLANRSALLRCIESSLDTIRHAGSGSMAVLAIGFDHVQHITSTFGADFASRVLVIAAERVEFILPDKDVLFRIGDFHLAIVLPNADQDAADALADKVVKEIEAPISLDSHTFMLHPSVGIAEVRSGYEYPESLLDHATAALAAVPRDASPRYCKFDSSTAKEAVGRLQLEVDLDRAFDEGELLLEYEPIVMPVTNAVAGFEALIRWDHPTEGRIPPNRFVPIAIQAGKSQRLNHWVMREAARQSAAWRRAGYMDLFINFNLSAEAFLRPQLDEEVGELLAEFDLPGNCLVVELTESALIQDLRAAARILHRLSELGLKAWLDDFGTGYSSLSYLRALPLRGVKIDRSFVERTVLDARDFGFLKSLIDLISYLGMQSIAEGIETKEQYELLSMTTCDLYQGYHFSRSMPAAQAERYMNEVGGVSARALRA